MDGPHVAARHGHMGMMAALLAAKGIDVNGATHAAVQGGGQGITWVLWLLRWKR